MAGLKNGKGRPNVFLNEHETDSGSDLEPYSEQYLDGLLEKATLALENAEKQAKRTTEEEEEVILLQQDENEP